MIDPYPAELMDTDLTPTAEPDPLVRAINRLAQAIEQQVLASLDNRPQPAQNAPQAPTGLAPLPPVQIIAAKPSCPYHGPDKVAASTNGQGGFYCQSKASPGQPSNPKGYCTWHT